MTCDPTRFHFEAMKQKRVDEEFKSKTFGLTCLYTTLAFQTRDNPPH